MGIESEVAQLRRGDPNALSALLMRYQNRLYRYLLRMVHEQAEAEDLFQQTWVRVAEKISQFDIRRNFEPWLFALARNLAIDHLRRVRPSSLDEPIGEAESDQVPDALVRFWLGHANKGVTDEYIKMVDELDFRKEVADRIGMGFELSDAPIVRSVHRNDVGVEPEVAA